MAKKKVDTDLEQPFKSWSFDEELGYWVAPVAIPNVSLPYTWNEDKGEWDLVEFPSN
jgi:hypothetical protein